MVANDDIKMTWKSTWPNSKDYPDRCLQELRKTTIKNHKYNSLCSGQDSKQAPLKYKSEMLLLEPTSSVLFCCLSMFLQNTFRLDWSNMSWDNKQEGNTMQTSGNT